jgi:hypothetical protein
MRFATVLSALLWLPGLSTALTIGDVTRNSITAFARQEIKERSLLSDILTDIENLAECSACEVSGVSSNCSVDRTTPTYLPLDSLGFAWCSQGVGSLWQR